MFFEDKNFQFLSSKNKFGPIGFLLVRLFFRRKKTVRSESEICYALAKLNSFHISIRFIMQEKTKCLFLVLVCAFNVQIASAQLSYFTIKYTQLDAFYLSPSEVNAKKVMQDNEIERNNNGQESVIPSNPLMLDGKKLDYGSFSLMSKGVLNLVKSEPVTGGVTAIPFYVSIRRDGKILENKKMRFANKSLEKINLSEILSFAKEGDVLIIKPVRAEDFLAKRILKLTYGGGC